MILIRGIHFITMNFSVTSHLFIVVLHLFILVSHLVKPNLISN